MKEPLHITAALILSEASSLRHTGRGNYADFMVKVAARFAELEAANKRATKAIAALQLAVNGCPELTPPEQQQQHEQ